MRSAVALVVFLAGCEPDYTPVLKDDPEFTDGDEDGFTPDEGDCDDEAPDVYPGAKEHCDGIDNDCDDFPDDGTVCSVVDKFPQRGELDVLFVVDNSLSMPSEQLALRNAVTAFVPDLFESGEIRLDTHLGVITTDMDDPGQAGRLNLVDEARFASSAMSVDQAIEWAEQALVVGTSGSASPEARSAIFAALFDHGEGENANFSRENARLLVVVVSDADDATTDPSVSDFLEGMEVAKSDTGFEFHAIVVEAPCDGGVVGDAHIELAEAANGTVQDICEHGDYAGFLNGLAQGAVNESLQVRFELEHVPAGPLMVEKIKPNGDVDEDSPLVSGEDYEYAEASRAIILDRPHPAGWVLRVSYMREP